MDTSEMIFDGISEGMKLCSWKKRKSEGGERGMKEKVKGGKEDKCRVNVGRDEQQEETCWSGNNSLFHSPHLPEDTRRALQRVEPGNKTCLLLTRIQTQEVCFLLVVLHPNEWENGNEEWESEKSAEGSSSESECVCKWVRSERLPLPKCTSVAETGAPLSFTLPSSLSERSVISGHVSVTRSWFSGHVSPPNSRTPLNKPRKLEEHSLALEQQLVSPFPFTFHPLYPQRPSLHSFHSQLIPKSFDCV